MAEPIAVTASESKEFLFKDQFQLTWNDFTKVNTQPTIGSTKVHAIVAMSCEFRFDRKGKLPLVRVGTSWKFAQPIVEAVMDKQKSTVWDKILANSADKLRELLKHERVHVEIGERHSRMVHNEVLDLTSDKKDVASAAQDLVNKAAAVRNKHWKKCSELNAQYDHDTNHGTNPKTQKIWNALYLKKDDA